MAETSLNSLRLQLQNFNDAIIEFTAIEAELQRQPKTVRSADLLRINRETINSMTRSAELVRERLVAVATRPPVAKA